MSGSGTLDGRSHLSQPIIEQVTHVSGELAQLGERLVCNQEVTGSSPVFSTTDLTTGRSEIGRDK